MTQNPPKPPGDFTLEQFEAMRPLARLMGIFKPEIRERFKEVESHVENVKTIMANRDLFAQTFSPLGWVNYDRMSVVAVADALKVGVEEGEAVLTAYHLDPDSLRVLGYRFHTRHYEAWGEIYERAVERAGAEDFLSAVPLILIIIDGICTTTTAKHPFSGGADAPVFDTQTSGPGGLSEGLALLGSTRRKLDAAPISVPYRHGVVHGLRLMYSDEDNNALVRSEGSGAWIAMPDFLTNLWSTAMKARRSQEEGS